MELQNGVKQKMENKDNRNLEEEMDTASEAKAGTEAAEGSRPLAVSLAENDREQIKSR